VQLQWEKSSTGQKATLAPQQAIRGPVLGGVAHSKANDVARVWATFGGEGVALGADRQIRPITMKHA